MLNFVKTAIVLLASTQALSLQAEADYDNHDWTIYSKTHNVGIDYLDLTPDDMGDYEGIYQQNIARTEQGLKDFMADRGHGPILKHGYWEMDLRDLTDKGFIRPITNKAIWANIRVLADKVPARGDTRAFNDQEYALLVSKQESAHWRPEHLAPDAPRTEENNCFMDFYSVRETQFGSECRDGFSRQNVKGQSTCVEDCGDGFELNSVGDCVQQCPDSLINEEEGRYCDKQPNNVDWLNHPIWLNDDGRPIDPCPLGMAEVEDGSACVKKYFEPEQENPTCQDGFVMDVMNAPKCRKECIPGYFPAFDWCYGRCPEALKQCGALCVEEDFICTDEQLEMSTEHLGQADSLARQTEVVVSKGAPVCSIPAEF